MKNKKDTTVNTSTPLDHHHLNAAKHNHPPPAPPPSQRRQTQPPLPPLLGFGIFYSWWMPSSHYPNLSRDLKKTR